MFGEEFGTAEMMLEAKILFFQRGGRTEGKAGESERTMVKSEETFPIGCSFNSVDR